MRIGRIKKIINTGTFNDFQNGSSLGFEKLTFVYGFNTYGKTTLADIFSSLKTNDPEIIQSRKTIPIRNVSQKIVFTERGRIENDVKFENGRWNQNNLHSHIEIFGTDFIYKNLFTGFAIKRENRENFTQFVLGERGVNMAGKITSKKQILRIKKSSLKVKVPPFVKNKSEEDINKFLKLCVQGMDKDNLEKNLSQKRDDLQNEQERIKNPQRILSLQEPQKYKAPKLGISPLETINNLLQKDYSSVKDEVLRKLSLHISSNFSDHDGAESWLKHGTRYRKGNQGANCPFCGRALTEVKELMDVYRAYFDPAYTKFADEISSGLTENTQLLENTYYSQKSSLQDILTKANRLKRQIVDKDFQKILIRLETTISQLDEGTLNFKKKQILEQIRASNDLKNKSPYGKVKAINFSAFKISIEDYCELLSTAESLVDQIRLRVKEFKDLYRNTKIIQNKIDELAQEIEGLEQKRARIEQDDYCREYLKTNQQINILKKQINALQEQLKTEQSSYLENYFSLINALFKKLGSKNFSLGRRVEYKGHMPVFSLQIKFHDEEIPNDQLKTVFSDSDRRALALAIFWAKIKLKNDVDMAKTTILLDDPVTSFDDNRITNTISLLKDTLGEIDQMVILTHYPHFIKRFCEITKETQVTSKFLEIRRNRTTSYLCEAARNDFVAGDYEKIFTKIYGFINRRHSESIKADLRPFIENLYLPTVFTKQIRDRCVDCSTLESMIDGIFDNQEVRTKMHEFRTALNPDSHIFTSNNDEDVRNFASEMMDYLYSLNLS